MTDILTLPANSLCQCGHTLAEHVIDGLPGYCGPCYEDDWDPDTDCHEFRLPNAWRDMTDAEAREALGQAIAMWNVFCILSGWPAA